MALPEHYRTEENKRIEKALLMTPITELESLTMNDLQLIGAFVQLYNFLELNLRRSVAVFAQAGLVEKSQGLLTSSKLVQTAKHAVARWIRTKKRSMKAWAGLLRSSTAAPSETYLHIGPQKGFLDMMRWCFCRTIAPIQGSYSGETQTMIIVITPFLRCPTFAV